ncbi:hypothetical protein AMS68_000245 [Peltaster fructicola]|uniref:DUF7728 domain-containing protein n=1 Tax=Peltaster fructicola TaxID=286661 RepID=A0A6H0XJB1_9PEZI|nr:hypothetical protein AMS68_000245 [Peltaster fructicola]
MLGRNLGLTISCALGASAFLLPPGVSSDKDAVLPFVAVDPKHQTLELPCPTCDSLTTHSFPPGLQLADESTGSSNLMLNLDVSDDGQALLLNEKPLYPLDYALEDIHDIFWAVQPVPVDASAADAKSANYDPLRITGHVLSSGPSDMLTPDGDSVITLRWQLLNLEHEMVDLDEVMIQLLRTSEGELLILSADVVPAPEQVYTIQPFTPLNAPPPPPPPPHHKECKYLPGPLCDMSNFFDSKLSNLKSGRPGCGGAKKFNSFEGRLPTHIKPHFGQFKDDQDMPERPDFKGPPFHGGPWREHRHHKHHHHMFYRIALAIESILTPVLLGLGVGLIVAPLGFLTGRLIGWLWFSVIRGGKRGYARVALDDNSEQDKLDESVEPLPQYEEAPAYEVTEKEALLGVQSCIILYAIH